MAQDVNFFLADVRMETAEEAAFISGSDFLIDGGVAAHWWGDEPDSG